MPKPENQYKNLTESLDEVVYRADPKTLVATYVNRAIEKVYGYTVEEWLNNPKLWGDTIHPEDKQRVFAGIKEAIRKAESKIFEYRIIKKDRTIRWVKDRLNTEKDQHGIATSINGIRYDITERKRAEEELKRKDKNVQILNKITQAAHRSHDLEEVYNIALDMTIELNNVDMTLIYLVDKDRKEAIVQAHRNLPEDYMRRARRIPSPKGATWKVINTGKIENIANVQEDPNIGPAGKDLGHHGILGIPITSEKETIGVIWFLSYKEIEFDKDEVDLLTSIGDQIALAISKAKIYKDLVRKNRHEEIIRTVTQIVHSSINLQEVFENAAGSMSENLDVVDSVAIYMVEGKEAVLKAHRGLSNSFLKRAATISYPKGLTWRTIQEGKPRYCAETDKDEYIGPAGKKEGIKSYLSMPITYEGKTVGCINLNSKQKNAIDEQELQLLEIVSNQISIAINNAQQAENLYESQSRFSGILDIAQDAIISVNEALEIVLFNQGAEQVFGYHGHEVLGKPLDILLPQRFREVHSAHIQNFLVSPETSIQMGKREAISGLRKNGTEFPAAASASKLELRDKKVLTVILRDITKEKQAEEDIKKQNRDLEKAYQKLKSQSAHLIQTEKMVTVGTMVAGIAHELNNPMMGIMNYVDYCLKNTSEDDKRYDILNKTSQACNRCIKIVSNLLRFSHKGSEDKKQYQKENCVALFKNVLSLLSHRIKNEKVLVLLETSVDIPDIWMKVSSIQQVYLNLVTNALDAMEHAEEKKIQIHFDVEGGFVQTYVSDSGYGIPEEKLTSIFDLFYTTKPVGKGTGLGLGISRDILYSHGGEISCESEVGAGTTFKISLPIEPEGNGVLERIAANENKLPL